MGKPNWWDVYHMMIILIHGNSGRHVKFHSKESNDYTLSGKSVNYAQVSFTSKHASNVVESLPLCRCKETRRTQACNACTSSCLHWLPLSRAYCSAVEPHSRACAGDVNANQKPHFILYQVLNRTEILIRLKAKTHNSGHQCLLSPNK